jgi:hypothetical protein
MRHASLLIVSLFLVPAATNAAEPLELKRNEMNQKDLEQRLHAVLSAFDTNLFPEGSPPRPNALAQEHPATLGHAEGVTSTGLPLGALGLSSPPLHIPNGGDGANARHAYKSELILMRDLYLGTKKIMWWHDRDPRDTPHNHPWDFRSAILSGGYTEQRYWTERPGGEIKHDVREYKAGDFNLVPANVFHSVTKVLPGTVTYLDCGATRPGGDWGYLDLGSGKYIPFKEMTPGNFIDIFRQLNTHLGKK